MSRPRFLPAVPWAEDGEIEAPSLEQQKRGWGFESVVPHKTANWLWYIATGWAREYAKHASTFKTFDGPLNVPETAPFEEGWTAYVDEESHGFPGSVENTFPVGAGVNVALAASPRGVVVMSVGVGASVGDPVTVTAFNRTGEPRGTFPSLATVGEAAVKTDGAIVVVAGRDTLECFDAVTLTLRWRVALPARDSGYRRIALSHELVFVVTETNEVKGYARADGSLAFDWASPNPGTILDIATDGESVFVLEDVLSPVVLHRVFVSTGLAAWSQILFATNPLPEGRLALDEHSVYVAARDDNGEIQFEARNRTAGTLRWNTTPTRFNGTNNVPLIAIQGLVADGALLWACDGLGCVVKLDPMTSYTIGSYAPGDGSARDIAADGVAVWVALEADVAKLRTGHPLRLWRRVDPTSRTFLPLHQVLIPA